MFFNAKAKYKAWRVARLHRRISKIEKRNWILPYRSSYREATNCVSMKPLFFTDTTSLESFIDEVIDNGLLDGVEATIVSPILLAGPVSSQVEQFAKSAPRKRTRLEIQFTRKNKEATISFSSKTSTGKARTEISRTEDEQLLETIMSVCDHAAKPMRFIDQHRTIPLVEPIDTREESDRRSRWETNWKNIAVSAMTGLLGGLVPVFVKAILHL